MFWSEYFQNKGCFGLRDKSLQKLNFVHDLMYNHVVVQSVEAQSKEDTCLLYSVEESTFLANCVVYQIVENPYDTLFIQIGKAVFFYKKEHWYCVYSFKLGHYLNKI